MTEESLQPAKPLSEEPRQRGLPRLGRKKRRRRVGFGRVSDLHRTENSIALLRGGRRKAGQLSERLAPPAEAGRPRASRVARQENRGRMHPLLLSRPVAAQDRSRREA